MSRALAELALGARLAVTGGRTSRLRALMTALGVGLGVALLLIAASVPTMIHRSEDRESARGPSYASVLNGARDDTLLIAYSDTTFRGVGIRGRDVQPEGPDAPLPPGLSAYPGPGEMVVSPELRALLAAPGGRLLRERLDARIVGTIGDAGLRGPTEQAFYRGTTGLKANTGTVQRTDAFGQPTVGDPYGPLLNLLVAIAVVILLLPVAIFVAAAVRFGGEDRDRRLAALRLVGADRAMAARIATGEALLGAVLGLGAGVVLFFAVRPLMERVSLENLSVFAQDVRPGPALAALIVVGVPVAAVLVSLLALRGVVIEPLGVVRQASTAKRRLWWRLVPGAAGAALIWPLHGNITSTSAQYQAGAGVFFVLVAVTALLPWLVEVVVRRLDGGPLSWQLATRRLQFNGGAAARVVSGIAVAVAGAVALQTLFSAAQKTATLDTFGDPTRAQAVAGLEDPPAGFPAGRLTARLERTPGVRGAVGIERVFIDDATSGSGEQLTVGTCRALRELARITDCRDGDTFLVGASSAVQPGSRLRLGYGRDPVRWTVPAGARAAGARIDPAGNPSTGVLVTPRALDGSSLPQRSLQVFVQLDPAAPDAIEEVRNTVARLPGTQNVYEIASTQEVAAFSKIRRGVFAAAICVLVLIGASLLVGALEQLRERRRVLAVLVAFGTRRGTMARSVLWQAAIPVAFGLAVAVAVGSALGALLLWIADQPILFDWGAIAAMAGAGGAVVLLVTLLSMPALWRLMRPDGLRTE